jgi:hypothetical protein
LRFAVEVWNLPQNRYDAIEEIRKVLGFGKTEWKCLLKALAKTDSGWLQFMFGNVCVDFKKVADVEELHLHVRSAEGKTKKAIDYTFDLNDFAAPKVGSQQVSYHKK